MLLPIVLFGLENKHFARLKSAVQYWEMELPDWFTEASIAKDIERLCNKNRLFQGARARLTIFRSGEGLYTPNSNKASYLLEVSYFPEQRFVLNDPRWKIDVYEEEYKYPTKVGKYKTAQCFLSVKGSLYKQKKGLDEVLLLSPQGTVVEATAYNVFALKGQVLLTPELKSGCVEGVMRSTVMEYASELGCHVEEDAFPLRVLEEADEIFLTNAVVGIRSVVAWRERRYLPTKTMELVALLNEKLLK